MFEWLKRSSHKGGGKKAGAGAPKRAPGATVREGDLSDLRSWATGKEGVEGFVEPETFVNEMSIVLVDAAGNHIRRQIGGPKGIDVVARELNIPIFDVEETGYPARMRQRIEADRIIRRRLEQMERREKLRDQSRDQSAEN